MKTILTKSTLHELQVTKFISIRGIGLGKDALVEHLFVNFQELFLWSVDIDQGRYYIVLAPLRRNELHWFALRYRHGLPNLCGGLVFIWTDIVLIVAFLLLPTKFLLRWLQDACGRLRLIRLILRSSPWESHVLLVVKLLIQLEVIIVKNDLNNALQGVLAPVEELFESVADFLQHQSRRVEQLHHINSLDIEAKNETRWSPNCQQALL